MKKMGDFPVRYVRSPEGNWRFPEMRVPQIGWFTMENAHLEMDEKNGVNPHHLVVTSKSPMVFLRPKNHNFFQSRGEVKLFPRSIGAEPVFSIAKCGCSWAFGQTHGKTKGKRYGKTDMGDVRGTCEININDLKRDFPAWGERLFKGEDLDCKPMMGSFSSTVPSSTMCGLNV